MKRKGGRRQSDLTGMRFGSLVAIERANDEPSSSSGVWWACRCDCGASKDVRSGNLVGGAVVSCGARQHEPVDAVTGPHGATFQEIADVLGVSKQRARCIYEQAMRKIRNNVSVMNGLGGHRTWEE